VATAPGAATALDPVRKGERTRQRLLEIAVRRFSADGYRRASVSAVAREAGLTPAAAYAYFPNKEALFAAAVDHDAEALIAVAGTAAGTGPVRGRLPLLIGSLLTEINRHPLAQRVLAGKEPEVIGRLLDLPAVVALREETAALVAAGQRDGTVRPDLDPATAALGLETVVLALLMAGEQAAAGAPELLEARAAGVVEVLDAALRPAGAG
jgi:AcrR family transcriptional regulator